MKRGALIASVFLASYESPRVLVRFWWRRASSGELSQGRYFVSVISEREPFKLVTSVDLNVAQAAFDRLVREEEEAAHCGELAREAINRAVRDARGGR